MITVTAVLVAALSGQATSIENYTQPNFHDISFTAKVVKADQPELAKINNDFGTSYRFSSTHVEAKEPFMIRLDARAEETDVVFVVNGARKLVRIPRAHIVNRVDVSRKPGERQTLFDFGILTPSLFESLYSAKFVRNDRETGNAVFDVTYQNTSEDSSRSRIWIDKAKKVITKREWFNQWGRQLATFYYLKPQEVEGVWIPTRLEVKNVDNVVGGITQYDGIRVNAGIADSQFAIK